MGPAAESRDFAMRWSWAATVGVGEILRCAQDDGAIPEATTKAAAAGGAAE